MLVSMFPLQNEDLTYVYRPAPNNEGSTSFYIRDSMLETLAYNAKVSGHWHTMHVVLRLVDIGMQCW